MQNETMLDDKLKQTLREAQSRLDHGGRAMLVKARIGTKRIGIKEQRDPEDLGYKLDDSVFSLPPKD